MPTTIKIRAMVSIAILVVAAAAVVQVQWLASLLVYSCSPVVIRVFFGVHPRDLAISHALQGQQSGSLPGPASPDQFEAWLQGIIDYRNQQVAMYNLTNPPVFG